MELRPILIGVLNWFLIIQLELIDKVSEQLFAYITIDEIFHGAILAVVMFAVFIIMGMTFSWILDKVME